MMTLIWTVISIILSIAVLGDTASTSSTPGTFIEDNNLGITARACAAAFCTTKDSLDLWLETEFICVGQYLSETLTPSIMSRLTGKSGLNKALPLLSSTITKHYSRISHEFVGVLCSIVALMGLWGGYTIGRAISKKSALLPRRETQEKLLSHANAYNQS